MPHSSTWLFQCRSRKQSFEVTKVVLLHKCVHGIDSVILTAAKEVNSVPARVIEICRCFRDSLADE